MPEPSRTELARQVVVGLAVGAASYSGPVAGTLASGAAPAVLAGMDYISATIGTRRLEHATETLGDAADESGAKTPEEFIEFVKAAVRDEQHQELLARALTIAQDTATRCEGHGPSVKQQLQCISSRYDRRFELEAFRTYNTI